MGDDFATEHLTLDTSDGCSLEAELALPVTPRAAVVLTHPHPLFGGNMHSIVTSELFRRLPTEDVATLRFNFRGVGQSTGSHGQGVDEVHDVAAAIDELDRRTTSLPLLLAGWSFGADVALQVTDERLAGWFLVAAPLRIVDPTTMGAAYDPRPKVIAQPEHDEYRPPEAAREVTAAWVNTELVVVPGADHFLVGRTDRVGDLLTAFLDRL